MDFQKVANAIEKSPQNIKDLLFSPQVGEVLRNLFEKNNLSEEQALKITDEIGYIILGLRERSSLKSTLLNLGIGIGPVASMLQDVNKEIYSKIDMSQPKKENLPQMPKPDANGPIIITKDNKTDALKNLQKMSEEISRSQDKTSSNSQKNGNLPMIEPGEVAHEVPHIETKPQIKEEIVIKPETVKSTPEPVKIETPKKIEEKMEAKTEPIKPMTEQPKEEFPKKTEEKIAPKLPDNRYPGGVDPYREPIA